MLDPDDPRRERWDQQYKEWGFDETEIWDLTNSICHFLVPRLKKFREMLSGLEKRERPVDKESITKMIENLENYIESSEDLDLTLLSKNLGNLQL